MISKLVKPKLGELEEEIRKLFRRLLRTDLTRVVGGFFVKKRHVVKFEYGLNK